MIVLQTRRLILRRLASGDAPFIVELLNDPMFIEHIGDKGVRTLGDAQAYLRTGPIASYEQFGFGLFRVELKDDGTAIGMCGLLKRDNLADVDIGFAFLPPYRSQGYATESASAVMNYAREVLRIERIVAVTSRSNELSAKVLEKIGLRFERLINFAGQEADTKLFVPASPGGKPA